MEGFEGGRRAVGGSWCEDDEAMESLPGRQHRLPLRSDRSWHLTTSQLTDVRTGYHHRARYCTECLCIP